MRRALSIMPIAFFIGICLGSLWTPPAPAYSPTRGSGSPTSAWSAAMIMSHASAISKPPPRAYPLTAAMMGFQHSKSDVMPPSGARSALAPGLSRIWSCSAVYRRSLPALNARSPVPVRIATHTSGSSRNSQNALYISMLAGGCRAFRRSGRLIVT